MRPLAAAFLLVAAAAQAGGFDSYVDSLSDTPKEKAALRQYAAAVEATYTVDLADRAAVLEAYRKLDSGSWCVVERYVIQDKVPDDTANDRLLSVRHMVPDTPQKEAAVRRFFNTAWKLSLSLDRYVTKHPTENDCRAG